MRRIHVLNANPNTDSFDYKLAQVYYESAIGAGHKATFTHIADLQFDYNLLPDKELEPDAKSEQAKLEAAEHIVIVTPVWWNAYPACLKAYFDRLLVPDFAFSYPHPWPIVNRYIPRKLLKGRSARIISTRDSPALFAPFLGFPIAIGMRFAVLWFVGIWPVRHTRLTNIRNKSGNQRNDYIKRVEKLARSAK